MLVLLFALEKKLHKNPFGLNLLSFCSNVESQPKGWDSGASSPASPSLLLRTAWLHAFVVTIKCDSAFKAFCTVLDINFQRLALPIYRVVL